MPFQPLPDDGPGKPTSIDLGFLFIRVVACFAFVYYQLISLLSEAGKFIWEKSEWKLVSQIEEKGLPFANVLAVVFVAVLTIALLGILIGIFSRLNGLLLTIVVGMILLVPIDLGAAITPQTTLLFTGIFFAIALGGAGKISLDFILAGRKARKKKPF